MVDFWEEIDPRGFTLVQTSLSTDEKAAGSSQGVSDFPKPRGQLECSSCCSFQPSVLPTCPQALQGSFGRVGREGNSGNPGPICEHP